MFWKRKKEKPEFIIFRTDLMIKRESINRIRVMAFSLTLHLSFIDGTMEEIQYDTPDELQEVLEHLKRILL